MATVFVKETGCDYAMHLYHWICLFLATILHCIVIIIIAPSYIEISEEFTYFRFDSVRKHDSMLAIISYSLNAYLFSITCPVWPQTKSK